MPIPVFICVSLCACMRVGVRRSQGKLGRLERERTKPEERRGKNRCVFESLPNDRWTDKTGGRGNGK